jgi:DivIVA domain-containing protein
MDHSRGFDLITVDEDAIVDASFDVSLRGYDRHQVDAYVARTERELHELAEQAEAAERRAKELAAELEKTGAELARARRFVRATDGRPTYAALGRRVEQILTLAEEQADDIRAKARDTAIAAVSPSPLR